MAAKLIARLLKGKGRVIELEGIPGTSAALERGVGFNEALKAFPDIKVVAREVADFELQKAKEVVLRTSQRNLLFDGIFAHNDNMILGAAEALEALGASSAIVLVGFDGIQAALEALRQGRINATIAQKPDKMGTFARSLALCAFGGEKSRSRPYGSNWKSSRNKEGTGMFRTINQRFYTIAGVLVFLFCLNYVQLAYFINEESDIAAQGEDIIDIERNIRNLLSLFFRMRYWERAVFSQEFPDAERHFGQIMAEMKSQLSILRIRSPETFISRDLEEVTKVLVSYEQHFNQLNQLNTDHRLQLTRLESSYQSLAYSILDTGKLNFLKPLLIITQFQIGYVRAHQQTEYQALNVVINSLKNKFAQDKLLNERLESYMDGYRRILEEDFGIDQKFKTVAGHFNDTSAALTELLKSISGRAQELVNDEFSAAEAIRKRLKYSISNFIGPECHYAFVHPDDRGTQDHKSHQIGGTRHNGY